MDKNKKAESWGEKIVDAMTSKQLASLINGLFHLMESEEIKGLLSKLDEDISSALESILNKEDDTPELTVTDAKHAEEWEKAWGDWYDIILELGDEEGFYVCQDNHWETPYFNGNEFSSSLEEISKKLLPLIDKTYSLNIMGEDCFWEALKDIDNGIDRYPEWMGAEYSECILGPAATNCILEWEWRVANSEENPAYSFLDRVSAIESTLKTVSLDDSIFIGFFVSLPREAKKGIYKKIKGQGDNPIWQARLQNVYSKWHHIYHFLLSLFDQKEYIQSCFKYLHERWEYGLAIVKNLIRQKKYLEAEKIVKKTFSSLLDLKEGRIWLPENLLLINEIKYYYNGPDERVVELLQDWILISEKTGNKGRASILLLQLVLYRDPYELDDNIGIFKRLLNSPYSNDAKGLFKQWKDYIDGSSISIYSEASHKGEGDNWIHWLVEAGIDDGKGGQWFISKVSGWLKLVAGDPMQFKDSYSYISTLTKDLSYISQLGKNYPILCSVVGYSTLGQSDCALARQRKLKDLGADELVEEVIKCWEKSIAVMVPDPSEAAKSDYTVQARWLLAVYELNKPAGRKILKDWKLCHRRRRNLWKALDEVGLRD